MGVVWTSQIMAGINRTTSSILRGIARVPLCAGLAVDCLSQKETHSGSFLARGWGESDRLDLSCREEEEDVAAWG